jgi:ferric-dicitrate binding protein FerR (iron transport regulator)
MKEDLFISEIIKDDIISYLSGSLSKDQAERLKEWKNENPDQKRFFDEITDVWQSTASLSNKAEFDPQKAWDDIAASIQVKFSNNIKEYSGQSFWTTKWLKVAAIFIFAFLLGSGSILFLKKPTLPPYVNEYVTLEAPLGSKSFATLPDGTKVWLNAGTKLRYKGDYGVKIREISLDGEAYFVVAKNKHKPFIVRTSDINIKALGTSFNVKAYAKENTIETTLEEGSVRIDAIDTKSSNAEPIILKPNQKAVFSRLKGDMTVNASNDQKQVAKIEKQQPKEEIKTLEVIAVPDIRVSTSWKDLRWVIRHEKLSNLVVMLERRYAVSFTFEDDKIKEYVFNGTLLDESLEQVLEVIKIAAPIDYNISHKNVTLSWNKQFKDKYQNLLLEQKSK